jgi:hypothetical protein
MDFLLLLMGVIELLYIILAPNIVEDKFLIGMRSLRILRILKVATKLQKFRDLIKILIKAVQSIGTYLLLLAILNFTYACAGMEFFGLRLWVDGNGLTSTRALGLTFDPSYDYFLDAFKTVFVQLTNDNYAYVFQIAT